MHRGWTSLFTGKLVWKNMAFFLCGNELDFIAPDRSLTTHGRGNCGHFYSPALPPPSLPPLLSYTHTHTHNKKITTAHFLSQLKGKITRFPQQISPNEWFIICVKHGRGWMRSLRPLSVGLINHAITETSGGPGSGVERDLWSECTFAPTCSPHVHFKPIVFVSDCKRQNANECRLRELKGDNAFSGVILLPRGCQPLPFTPSRLYVFLAFCLMSPKVFIYNTKTTL